MATPASITASSLLRKLHCWVILCTHWGYHYTRSSSQASPSCGQQMCPSSPRACSYKCSKCSQQALRIRGAHGLSNENNNRAGRPPRTSLYTCWIQGIERGSLSFPLPHQIQPIASQITAQGQSAPQYRPLYGLAPPLALFSYLLPP